MMRVLLAPNVKGFKIKRDFSWTSPGELLTINPMTCDSCEGCGCDRAFSGLTSCKATTLGIVSEMSEADVRVMIEQSALLKGWEGVLKADDVMSDMRIIDVSCQNVALGEPMRVKIGKRSVRIYCTGKKAA